jgi:hypothetical protein
VIAVLEWKQEWGEIGCYKVSIIAEKLSCTVAQARALKGGFTLDHLTDNTPTVKPIESEADHGTE